MPPRTLAVVNPASRAGDTGRIFPRFEPRLRQALGELEVAWTRGPRDAERIAREAARAGVERLLVAGGDGTACEVVSGVLSAELGDRVELGFLPLGSGGDLPRTLGIPGRLEDALELLHKEQRRRIDAGRLRFRDPSGAQRVVYFVNEASAGMSGLVTRIVGQTSKSLGARMGFLWGTLVALARFQPRPARVRLDGRTVHEGPLVLATASNGRFFGGGMQVAPEACPDDGLLDVVIVPGLSKATLLARLPRLYAGTHLAVAGVELHRGRRVEIEALGPQVPFEADGEPFGDVPLEVEVVPGAIEVVGVPV